MAKNNEKNLIKVSTLYTSRSGIGKGATLHRRRYLMIRTLKLFKILFLVFFLHVSSDVFAMNGSELAGVGPISRSMGGTGIANPQDAITTLFTNPAGVITCTQFSTPEVDVGGSLLAPKTKASITVNSTSVGAYAASKVYPLPATAISVPFNNNWNYGIGMAAVAGFGADFRNTTLDQSSFYNLGSKGKYPLMASNFSQLQILKVASFISYHPDDKLSIGIAPHIDYGSLDLGLGTSSNYGIGAQVGGIYKFNEIVSLGVTYTTAQTINYKDVYDPAGDGIKENLKLDLPQKIGIGIALKPFGDNFLIETDIKWLNWANAKGYKEFDWGNQWVYSVGAQYKPIQKLALRVGYNYGKNPLKSHDNFDGSTSTNVQGNYLSTYYYEMMRVIGAPLVEEQHLFFGVGYDLTKNFVLNAGYGHDFNKTLTENGTNFLGQPVSIMSTVGGDSVEFNFVWRF
ncbi:MAG: outer membrane protein transport protein [Nitrospirae bacterium]|nr:outer membrane protein transport protein [Nitrospirota bacterium]